MFFYTIDLIDLIIGQALLHVNTLSGKMISSKNKQLLIQLVFAVSEIHKYDMEKLRSVR